MLLGTLVLMQLTGVAMASHVLFQPYAYGISSRLKDHIRLAEVLVDLGHNVTVLINEQDRKYMEQRLPVRTINRTDMSRVRCSCCLPITPCPWLWSNCLVVCSAAMRSLHCASRSATATGFVHKSRGDNTVPMCVLYWYLLFVLMYLCSLNLY